MGVDLKYDTLQLGVGQKNIEGLITRLDCAREAMRAGLEQIRTDWVSEGADTFFESIDTEWENSVQSCIDVLDDLNSALKQAIEKYSEISENASGYLKF